MDEKKSWLTQWKYWAQCSIKIIDEYSPFLQISNEQYVSTNNHALIQSNPKGFLLFGVLDEISKVGTSMFRWIEFISGDVAIDPKSYPARNIIQAVFEEQQMWGRKLLEALIDLILFTRTNEEAYYQHYLLLQELWDCMDSSRDWIEFYGIPSNSLNFLEKIWVENIVNLETTIELKNCWYVKKKVSISRTSGRTNKETFRQKLTKVLLETSSREKLIIGLTYKGYSEYSESIHFSLDRDKNFPNEKEIELNMSRIWFTIICIVNRLQQLMGVQPKGFNDEMNKLLSISSNVDDLIYKVTGEFFDINDIVLSSNNELCMIKEQLTSKYGYKVYRLAYLQRSKIPEPYNEWLPGHMIQLIYKFSDHTKAIESDPVAKEIFSSVAIEEYIIHYTKHFSNKWEQGMKDYFLKNNKDALLKAFKQ